MVEEFRRYVADNQEIHFSAGMIAKKPGAPVPAMVREADEALAAAKKLDGKNAFCIWGVARSWHVWPDVSRMEQELEEVRKTYRQLSTGFMYGLINLLDRRLQEDVLPEAALWRSSFAYRTARILDGIRDRQERRDAQRRIAGVIAEEGIAKMGDAFRIPLFNHLYQQR
jgi:CRISPR-associated protein Csm1